MVELTLVRHHVTDKYVHGYLVSTNPMFHCETLERNGEFNGKHLPIEQGKYWCRKYYSPKFKRMVLLLLGVRGFRGIEIHAGNTIEDTKGCILVGKEFKDGILSESVKALEALIAALPDNQGILLNIVQILDFDD